MWLKLDIDGIIFQLQVRSYQPSTTENWDSEWCRIGLSLASRNWLNYMIENDEVLLSFEVQVLTESLEMLLNDELNEISEIECIEPDFKFILHPKKDLTNNYLSIEFDRDDMEYLSNYLNMVMGNIDKKSETITDMINKGLIYG